MSKFLARLDKLGPRMKTLNREAVVYQNKAGTYEVDGLLASRMAHEREEEGTGGVVLVNIDAVDWVIDPADLILNGQVTLPARGDKIISRSVDGVLLTYEVVGRDTDPHYKYTTSTRNRMIISTVLVTDAAL